MDKLKRYLGFSKEYNEKKEIHSIASNFVTNLDGNYTIEQQSKIIRLIIKKLTDLRLKQMVDNKNLLEDLKGSFNELVNM